MIEWLATNVQDLPSLLQQDLRAAGAACRAGVTLQG